MSDRLHDVLVVGSGIGGLTAAAVCADDARGLPGHLPQYPQIIARYGAPPEDGESCSLSIFEPQGPRHPPTVAGGSSAWAPARSAAGSRR